MVALNWNLNLQVTRNVAIENHAAVPKDDREGKG